MSTVLNDLRAVGNITYGSASTPNTLYGGNDDVRHGRLCGTNITGAGNVLIGYDVANGVGATAVVKNVGIGYQALNSVVSGGDVNVAVGDTAGSNITTGLSNTCLGPSSGTGITTNNYNTCVGYLADTGGTGDYNTCLGSSATVSATYTNSTALGRGASCDASNMITLGDANVSIIRPLGDGVASLGDSTHNYDTLYCKKVTPDGDMVLITDTLAVANARYGTIAIGSRALQFQSPSAAPSGVSNIAIGTMALASTVGSYDNLAVGTSAGESISTGIRNTCVGNSSVTATTGSYNTAIGYRSGFLTGSGSNNTCIGANTESVDAVNNGVSVGYSAATRHDNSIALGANAATTAANQVMIGDGNITEVTCGSDGVASLGSASLMFDILYCKKITQVSDIVLITDILTQANARYGTIAIGSRALQFQSPSAAPSGVSNIAIGTMALASTVDSYDNLAIGTSAGESISTGIRNTCVGHSSMTATTGDYNTAIGYSSGFFTGSGSNNTCIGANTTTALTANNVVAVGFNSVAGFDNSTALGANSTATAANQVMIGDGNITEVTCGSNGVASLGSSALPFDTLYCKKITPNGDVVLITDTLAVADAGAGTIAIGSGALAALDPTSVGLGLNNIAIGVGALETTVDGANNIAIGRDALSGSTSDRNISIGGSSMLTLTTGQRNISIGTLSGGAMQDGSNNVFIGDTSTGFPTVTNCVCIGDSSYAQGNNSIALGANSTATAANQVMIGDGNITEVTCGSDGVASLGSSALPFDTLYCKKITPDSGIVLITNTLTQANAGNNTISIGNQALANCSGGGGNVAIGASAGELITTGSSNICIGVDAGLAITTGVGNVCIGERSDVGSGNTGLTTALGYNAECNHDSSIALGTDASTEFPNHFAISSNIAVFSTTSSTQVCDLGHTTRQFKDAYLSGEVKLSSTTTGFTPPVLTQTQQAAMTPTEGMVIYNSTSGTYNVYGSTQWNRLQPVARVPDWYQYDTIAGPGTVNNTWQSMAWSPTLRLFCMVAIIGSPKSATSRDGVEWVLGGNLPNEQWECITWGADRFVAVANSSNAISYSTDGVTWTAATTVPAEPISLLSVAYSPDLGSTGRYVALGNTSSSVAKSIYSDDGGVTWSDGNTLTVAANTGSTWSSELQLFICCLGAGQIARSADGISWTSKAEGFTCADVAWSPELSLLIAVSGSGGGAALSSRDGITWSISPSPSIANSPQITWVSGLGLFIITRDSGSATNAQIYTSPDGVTWTERASTIALRLRVMAYSPELNIVAFAKDSSTEITGAKSIVCNTLTTLTNTTPYGSWYLSATGTVNITSSGLNHRLSSATVSSHNYNYVHNSAGRLTYTGSKSGVAHVICSISFYAAPPVADCRFGLYKNGIVNGSNVFTSGTLIPDSTLESSVTSSTRRHTVTINCMVTMNENDYIEVYARNTTSADNIQYLGSMTIVHI